MWIKVETESERGVNTKPNSIYTQPSTIPEPNWISEAGFDFHLHVYLIQALLDAATDSRILHPYPEPDRHQNDF